jgi:hypothetical protein
MKSFDSIIVVAFQRNDVRSVRYYDRRQVASPTDMRTGNKTITKLWRFELHLLPVRLAAELDQLAHHQDVAGKPSCSMMDQGAQSPDPGSDRGGGNGPDHPQPTAVIAGVQRDGELVIVGRTGPLSAAQSRDLAAQLSPAGADHPSPNEIGSGVFGYRQRVPITKVSPVLVLEVAADPALHAGGYRHLLRYVRLRADMNPTDVEAP